MENQFTILGLPLLTPKLLDYINYSTRVAEWKAQGMLTNAAKDSLNAYTERFAIELSTMGEATASFAVEILVNGLESLPAALGSIRERDKHLVKEALTNWVNEKKPTSIEKIIGAAKAQAEMRAAGIITSEAGPSPAPVGSAVTASSPARPAPAATPAPTPPAAPLAPETLETRGSECLTPADHVTAPGFALADADRLALAVGLIDETGKYHLGPRKLGAVVGFCLALQEQKLLLGTVPDLTAVLGPRWGVTVKTRKHNDLARKYAALTKKALKTMKPTD